MASPAENISDPAPRKKLLSHRLFSSGKWCIELPVPSLPVIVPRNLKIALQHLPNLNHLTWRRFSRRMVLKLHLEGTSTGIVDGRSYIFKPGTAMLIFPFQPHWLLQVGSGRPDDRQERIVFTFSLTSEEQKMLLPLKDRIIRLAKSDYSLMLDILDRLQRGRIAEQAVCPCLLNQFFLSCLAQVSMDEQPTREGSPAARAVFDYLRRHYMENPTVAQMTEELKIGETKLRSLFRKELGAPPAQLIRSLRMRQAAELLCFTDRKINDISRQCGFPNPFAFCRSFRSIYALSPSEFRKRNKNGGAEPAADAGPATSRPSRRTDLKNPENGV